MHGAGNNWQRVAHVCIIEPSHTLKKGGNILLPTGNALWPTLTPQPHLRVVQENYFQVSVSGNIPWLYLIY